MTFNEFCIEEYGQNWQGIHMDLIEEGYDEDQLNEYRYKLTEEYEDYTEAYDLEMIEE